jgi:hypothetical protein
VKKYYLTEDIKWCGRTILNKGQVVYDMGLEKSEATAGRPLADGGTIICTNPETRSCQTYIQKKLLVENPSQIS